MAINNETKVRIIIHGETSLTNSVGIVKGFNKYNDTYDVLIPANGETIEIEEEYLHPFFELGDRVYDRYNNKKVSGIVIRYNQVENEYEIKFDHKDYTMWVKAFNLAFNSPKQKTKTKTKIKKEVKMSSLDKAKGTVDTASKAVMEETVDVSKIQLGKIIYNNLKGVAVRFMPTLTWYEKIFVSKEKRDTAELLAVYGVLHMVKTRYSHYAIDAVTMYINMELQTKLIGSINVGDLDNIFKLPKKK